MESEKFCLHWNDFAENISSAFRELREQEEFFDLTLACEDEEIRVHKVILAACSPFFRNILQRHPHQHTLLYLKGVKYSDLQAVITFMYQGEVNVAQEDLSSFLAVAADLKIKGLTENQRPFFTANKDSPATLAHHIVRTAPISSRTIHVPPPLKHSHPTLSHPIPSPVHHENELQELVSVKSEPGDPILLASPKQSRFLSTPDDDLCLPHQDDDYQHQEALQRPGAEDFQTDDNKGKGPRPILLR